LLARHGSDIVVYLARRSPFINRWPGLLKAVTKGLELAYAVASIGSTISTKAHMPLIAIGAEF